MITHDLGVVAELAPRGHHLRAADRREGARGPRSSRSRRHPKPSLMRAAAPEPLRPAPLSIEGARRTSARRARLPVRATCTYAATAVDATSKRGRAEPGHFVACPGLRSDGAGRRGARTRSASPPRAGARPPAPSFRNSTESASPSSGARCWASRRRPGAANPRRGRLDPASSSVGGKHSIRGQDMTALFAATAVGTLAGGCRSSAGHVAAAQSADERGAASAQSRWPSTSEPMRPGRRRQGFWGEAS